MDSDLIVIPRSSFPRSVHDHDKGLLDKYTWLKSTFKCFTNDNTSQWKKKHYNVVATTPSNHNAVRNKIGGKDLSCESIARKDVMSLMNKVTATNKEHIFNQLKTSLREQFAPMYIHVIWDFMLLLPDLQDVYVDVLLQLSCYIDVKVHITHIWESYIGDQQWVPMSVDDTGYDEFCDHVKWKKQSVAKVKGFCMFIKKLLLPESCYDILISSLIRTCEDVIHQKHHKHAEMLVDQIATFVSCAPSHCCKEGIVQNATTWKHMASDMPPALRFKLYDFYDLVTRKYENKK